MNQNPHFNEWWNILPQNYQVGGTNDDILMNHTVVNQCVRFNCEQHRIECSFKTVNKTFSRAKNELTEMFIKLHRKMLNLINKKDQIRITFFHDDLSHGIGYPFMDKYQLQNTNLQEKFDAASPQGMHSSTLSSGDPSPRVYSRNINRFTLF